MKQTILGVVAVAVSGVCLLGSLVCVARSEDKKDDCAGKVQASALALPTDEARLEDLLSVIGDPSVEAPNIASAMNVLAEKQSSKAVEVLVRHIEYFDQKSRAYPAVSALARCGESAVEPIMKIIVQESRGRRMSLAVRTLMEIKGTNYSAFIESQKDQISGESWTNLLRYSIKD